MTEFAALGTMLHARRPFVAADGRWWALWPLVLVRRLLLSLGGRGHLMGRCCRSWAAGIVCGGGAYVTFHVGDVVAGRMWVLFGRCVDVMGGWRWCVVVVVG